MNFRGSTSGLVWLLILFVAGIFLGAVFTNKAGPDRIRNIHVRFLMEVYDEVEVNYWQTVTEHEMAEAFKIAIANELDQPQSLHAPTRADLIELLRERVSAIPDHQDRKKFAIGVANRFLNALPPAKRSKVMSNEELGELAEKINAPSTIFAMEVHPGILYMRIKSFSPNSYEELLSHLELYKDNDKLNALVIDLRANSGGAIGVLKKFAGPFVGTDEKLYEIESKGQKTATHSETEASDLLKKFRQRVVLINRLTQSSAEQFSAVLRRFNLGVFVGEKTAGWGTVEKVKRLKQELDVGEYYTLYLVHALMLDDEHRYIQDRGIEPDIDITQNGWGKQLFKYYQNRDLVFSVQKVWNQPPTETP